MSQLPYSTIVVSGDDAFDFLQAQLAADLQLLRGTSAPSRVHSAQKESVAVSDSILSAWCNPKGRVICLMYVAEHEQGYTLTLPDELVDEAIRRLTMFRFRAKVEFEKKPATAEQLGVEDSFESWRLDNLRAGIAEILQVQSEQFTPHMLNLDMLDAVSVDKGCYPGQEIVARTHFRGATKRRLLRFESISPVKPGDKISDGEREVGEVLNAIGNDLLAVVPVDKAGTGLAVDGAALKHVPLPHSC